MKWTHDTNTTAFLSITASEVTI